MDENVHAFLVLLAHLNVSIMAELRLVCPTLYIYPIVMLGGYLTE